MFDPNLIFQRTHAGRDEIHEKKRGLTQSERLVLIMIDGTTAAGAVRSKLPVLTDERFNRALNTLQKKELILEVFLPLEGQAPEEMERTVIDRFLQQDPTDPLTVISFDPDEDFAGFAPAPSSMTQPASAVDVQPIPELFVPAPSPSFPHGSAAPASVRSDAAMDASLIEQADSLAEEMRARRPSLPSRPAPIVSRTPAAREQRVPEPSMRDRLHWGYLLIGVGLAFILGFILARITH